MVEIYLDLNLIEHLSVVNTNDGSNHLRNDDHITKMSLDTGRLLISSALKLGLAKTLDQGEGLALETAVEAAASTASNKIDELKDTVSARGPCEIPSQWA